VLAVHRHEQVPREGVGSNLLAGSIAPVARFLAHPVLEQHMAELVGEDLADLG